MFIFGWVNKLSCDFVDWKSTIEILRCRWSWYVQWPANIYYCLVWCWRYCDWLDLSFIHSFIHFFQVWEFSFRFVPILIWLLYWFKLFCLFFHHHLDFNAIINNYHTHSHRVLYFVPDRPKKNVSHQFWWLFFLI